MKIDYHSPHRTCPIAFIGEASGKHESERGIPFVGTAGKYLKKLLQDTHLDSDRCLLGNVFRTRPPNNDLSFFFSKERNLYKLKASYVKEAYISDIIYLRQMLREHRTKITVTLGVTALWALTGETTLDKLNGSLLENTLTQRGFVYALHHPAYIKRFKKSQDYMYQNALRFVAQLQEHTYSDLQACVGKRFNSL